LTLCMLTDTLRSNMFVILPEFSVFPDARKPQGPPRTPQGEKAARPALVGGIRQVPLGRSLKENSSARAKSLGSHSKSDDEDVARRRAAPSEVQAMKTSLAEMQNRLEVSESLRLDSARVIAGLKAEKVEHQAEKDELASLRERLARVPDPKLLKAYVGEIVEQELVDVRKVLCLQRKAWDRDVLQLKRQSGKLEKKIERSDSRAGQLEGNLREAKTNTCFGCHGAGADVFGLGSDGIWLGFGSDGPCPFCDGSGRVQAECEAEDAAQAEEARQAEEAAHAEQAARVAEEAARAEEAAKAEQAARLAEEAAKAEEVTEAAEDAAQAEDAMRAEEAADAEQAARVAEEAARAEEAAKAEQAARLAEEAAKAEQVAKAAEDAAQAEEARQAEETAHAEQAARMAEEAARAEEVAKAAEDAAQAEEARQANAFVEAAKADEAAQFCLLSAGMQSFCRSILDEQHDSFLQW